MICEPACCLLLRGSVYLQVGDALPRLIGNSSRLGISHAKSNIVPLDGSLASACDPYDAMKVNLSIKCCDLQNILLGLQGTGSQNASTQYTEVHDLPDVLQPGDLIPFEFVADVNTIKVNLDWLVTSTSQKFREGIEYETTNVGIEIKRCVYVPNTAPSNKQLTVKYKSIGSSETWAGEGSLEDAKLIYRGTNGFDGTPAILTIPKIRFEPMDGFEFISDTEAEIVITGDIIPQTTSPKWYSLVRPSFGC